MNRFAALLLALFALIHSTPADARRHHARTVTSHHQTATRPSVASNPNAGAISCPRGANAGSTATAGLTPVLQAKVHEITASCRTHVVSTYCRGGVTPNHRLGLAADLKGDPACIYNHLKGWPGGYSTDYAAVQHVHISYSHSNEWGYRFAHGGGRSHTMSARSHRGAVYAQAQPAGHGQFGYGNLAVH